MNNDPTVILTRRTETPEQAFTDSFDSREEEEEIRAAYIVFGSHRKAQGPEADLDASSDIIGAWRMKILSRHAKEFGLPDGFTRADTVGIEVGFR